MGIRIIPHAQEQRARVEAFNRRMTEGGAPLGFYADPVPRWIPKREGQSVWRELYIALENDDTVVGGFALKPQAWRIHGRPCTVADWQGPFSLGAVDNRYAALGLRMMREMTARQPLLYSWGHGGTDEPIVRMLHTMGWLMLTTPFLLRIVKPTTFLRKNAYLRMDSKKSLAQDLLALSGCGALGIHALHKALRARSRTRLTAEAEAVSMLGAIADATWERAKERYDATAVRDGATMDALVPSEHRTEEWPAPVRLRIRKRGEDLGWAVVVSKQLRGDPRFGDLRVGMIADYFGLPEDAGEIVHAAFAHLRDDGVDLVYANQSHPGWIAGFVDSGFVAVASRRLFCASPKLEQEMSPVDQTRRGLFLTNMDGHGPML